MKVPLTHVVLQCKGHDNSWRGEDTPGERKNGDQRRRAMACHGVSGAVITTGSHRQQNHQHQHHSPPTLIPHTCTTFRLRSIHLGIHYGEGYSLNTINNHRRRRRRRRRRRHHHHHHHHHSMNLFSI
ncbi:uncharacterized histidine-rich protein DDB_G0274557-like [Portunus trituberculatus]|uniref:uncharacterized histidine-rich protein DDB_G0274557-like n=1 Tax=Portunus trituberculatus TaxID=210409 RepID=UPI001E1D09E1|nr:uncharacterized histidine-rich protein DDB_G0274557-like [Portunus trituberculatus]